MRFLKLLILFLILFNITLAKDIERKVLVIVPDYQTTNENHIHIKLEAILNYYGYFCEYIIDDGSTYPKDISSYAGLIYWNNGLKSKDPVKLVEYFTKFKNKKLILIGDIPLLDYSNNNYTKKINKLLKNTFEFNFGQTWIENPTYLELDFKKSIFNFEKKLNLNNQDYFTQVLTYNNDFEVILKESYQNKASNSTFFAPWGFYSPSNKIFYEVDDVKGKNRWIINPFKMIEKVFDTNYPIPDTTTIEGKRIAYIHIDGDGILSKSFNGIYTIEEGFNFIKEQGLKTGISYIVSELDKDGPILKNSYSNNPLLKNQFKVKHNHKLLNSYAKKTFALPFVEPASHTYSHPFNWRKGIVAYSSNKNAKDAIYKGIKAFQEPDKQVNLDLELGFSLNYLRNLTNKPVDVVYWSGDCYPSIRDLKYIDKNQLLAFNGGDSRFDLQYNSYSYVTPLSLYSPQATQIYSSNSNENTYTELWTENFWRFRNVIKTFENTGFPKRIKPANTYYHYYSFAKKSSLKALDKIYNYYKKGDFNFIYPSKFIKIAKNFHDIKIEKKANKFIISNIKDLREFRFEGKLKISSNDILKSSFNKKLNVTYVTIKNNLNKAILEVN